MCSLKQDFENAVQFSVKKAVDKGFFVIKDSFTMETK